MFNIYCPRCGTGGHTHKISRVHQPVCKCSNCGLWITVVGDALLDHQVNVRIGPPDVMTIVNPPVQPYPETWTDHAWKLATWKRDYTKSRHAKSISLGITIGVFVLWLLATR